MAPATADRERHLAEVSQSPARRRRSQRAVALALLAVSAAVVGVGCERRHSASEPKRRERTANATTPISAAAPVGASPHAPSARRPNVLLVVVDTLAARHLDAYGYSRPTAPFLTEEAAHGVLFADVTAAAPFTAPAMASLFTGLDGMHHGVAGHVPDLRFSRAHHTVAEAFREAGYATVGVVANPWLSAERGYDQGFEHYLHANEGKADARAAALLGALDSLPADRPWFAWLHILDTHMPYSPSAANRDRFDPTASQSLPLAHFLTRPISIDTLFFEYRYTTEDIERTRALYDAAILTVDEVLRSAVTALRARPGGDDLVVVYTSDHGEALCEHGLCWSHEFTLYQELMAVPLVLRAPGRLPAGTRVAAPVRTIDVAPTIAEIAGVSLGGAIDGESAVALARGGSEARPRMAFAESAPYREKYKKNPRIHLPGDEGRWKMVRDGRWKLIVVPRVDGDPAQDENELYDLERDPDESRNVGSEHADVVERLRAAIHAWVLTRRAAPADDAPPLTISPEERESLTSLGYTGP